MWCDQMLKRILQKKEKKSREVNKPQLTNKLKFSVVLWQNTQCWACDFMWFQHYANKTFLFTNSFWCFFFTLSHLHFLIWIDQWLSIVTYFFLIFPFSFLIFYSFLLFLVFQLKACYGLISIWKKQCKKWHQQ